MKNSEEKILEEKWKKYLESTHLFRCIPFIDFAIMAGSMAMGNPKDDSDFDIIVSAKQRRIFTVRMFCHIVFGLAGKRRSSLHTKESSKDKFCFNHFITKDSYKLSPPHNEYWKDLYSSLVPLYGKKDSVLDFLMINSQWVGETIDFDDSNWVNFKPNILTRLFELLLKGYFGDLLEYILKNIQMKRIEKGIRKGVLGHEPILIYNENELRFHIDTRRIEEYCK